MKDESLKRANEFTYPSVFIPTKTIGERGDVGVKSPLGVKFDEGKLPLHLLPPELMTSVASILQFGAKKYSPRNWEKGMEWSRVYDALLRHVLAWWGGEDLDLETGKSHLWHAGCCIAFLITYENRKVGIDDRPSNL